MKKAALLCYAFGKADHSTKMRIHRELYGYKDISNHGKYTYKRGGILETIKHKKILDGVIMINHEDASKLTKIFNKYSVKFHVFEVK